MAKKTEREVEEMINRQDDRRLENTWREAILVKMNHIIKGDLKKHGNK